MKMLANDEYVLDVCTELEHYHKKYFLLLKRTVWIHPLRLDNARYIDVMFFQVLHILCNIMDQNVLSQLFLIYLLWFIDFSYSIHIS